MHLGKYSLYCTVAKLHHLRPAPGQSTIAPHLLGAPFAVPPPHMTSLLYPAMTEHPGLTFVTALYRCRELGAALERFASAGTLYNVRRSLEAGAGTAAARRC